MAVNESLHSAFARVVCLFFLISVSAKALDPRLALEQFVHSNWVGAEIADNAGVSSLAQTKDGYLWVGTPRGLFRFDGWRFTSWGEIQDRPLREDRIRMLATDEDGDLWVGTAASLGQISPGEPIQYTERRGLPPGFLMALLPDPREGVWAATAGKASSGVARFLDRSMVALPAEKNGPESGGLSLAAGRDGNVWVGTRNGLRLIGPDGRELSFRSLGLEAFALALEPNGDVIVGGGASLFSIGGQGRGAAQRIAAFPHLAPQVARSDRDGNIWIGTLGGGLFRLGPGGVEQMRRRDGLSGDFVSAIFEDRKGNVWVGTDRGLDRFSNPTITRLPRVRGLDTSSLMVVEASRDGSVWLGAMRRGLIRMRNGSVTTYNLPGAVNSLHEDASGAMWVGTSQDLPAGETAVSPRYAGRTAKNASPGFPNHERQRGKHLRGWRMGNWVCCARAGIIRQRL